MHTHSATGAGGSTAATLLLLLMALVAVVGAANPEASPGGKRRLVVIGDIHGDADQARAVLRMAGITDAAGNWRAQQVPTTVVQMGDLVDRGAQDREAVLLFERLRREAAAPNEVIVLLGNHELMQLQGHFHYVHPDSNDEFEGGAAGRRRELGEGEAYGDFMRSLPVVHVDMGTLFVHAGLMPNIARRMSLAEINAHAREALQQKQWDSPLFSTSGPVWTRTQITHAMNGDCKLVNETLAIVGLKRMVVGHTPQRARQPGVFCDGTLLAVDVGISKWMYGGLAALEFLHDITSEHPADETEPLIYEVLPSATPDENDVLEETSASMPVQSAAGAQSGAEEEHEGAGSSKGTDEDLLLAAMKRDPTLLQEMMDVLHEKRVLEQQEGERDEENSQGSADEL